MKLTIGVVLLSQYVVPEESFDEYRDSNFERLASNFSCLESGDTIPAGRGYVHGLTEKQLLEELQNSPFAVESFESDEQYGGEGLLRYSRLRKK